jgi:tetratricopeptide (TPR) repeat protein
MRSRFHVIAVTALFAAGLAVPAQAQAPNLDPPNVEVPKPPDHPDVDVPKLPEPPSDPQPSRRGSAPSLTIDKLFEALKVAPTDDSAKYVENRIWSRWLADGGDTAGLLMTRVKTAVDSKQYDLAIKLLNAIIEIRPNYVEAWNRRATVYFMKKDFVNSIEDIREVLVREPRHFGALSGLGMIYQEIGDDKRALEAFRRALAIHPHLSRIPEMVKKLEEKVEGRDI